MNELIWKDISARIKILRKKNKITIERLSEIIGVSTSFIGLVERGDSKMSIDNLYKLSQVFNVSTDYLLTGNADITPHQSPSRFSRLNTVLSDYSEEELNFVIDLSKFLKSRIKIKDKNTP